MRVRFRMGLFLLLGLTLIASCSSSPTPLEFCTAGRGESRDSLVLDPNARTLRREGALFEYVVLESEVARGFVTPFPLTLPKLSAIQNASGVPAAPALQWELGDYSFSMTPGSTGDPDWVLITARPAAPMANSGETVWITSVLYSISDGVVAIRAVSRHGTEKAVSAAFSCGTSGMHASSF